MSPPGGDYPWAGEATAGPGTPAGRQHGRWGLGARSQGPSWAEWPLLGPSQSFILAYECPGPISPLNAGLIFPFVTYNYRSINSHQAISDLHQFSVRWQSQKKDVLGYIKTAIYFKRGLCAESQLLHVLLHKAYLKAAHSLARARFVVPWL